MIFLSVFFCSFSVYSSVNEKYWKSQKNTEISDLFKMSGKCLEILARCLEKIGTSKWYEICSRKNLKCLSGKNRQIKIEKFWILHQNKNELMAQHFLDFWVSFQFCSSEKFRKELFYDWYCICNISTVLYIVYVHQQTKKAIRHFSLYYQ